MTSLLQRVSLTGADAHTPLDVMVSIARRFPFVEWALLYSASRAGEDNRYPTVNKLHEFLGGLRDAGVDSAVHLCGAAVHDALEGHDAHALAFCGMAGRVQLNFNHKRQPVNLDALESFAGGLKKPVITQLHGGNAGIHALLPNDYHQVLFDASGGRGTRPDGWPAPLPGKACGYAGGLGPDTLSEDLDAIAKAAGPQPFWIDMETSLRRQRDWFELDTCVKVLTQAEAWQREHLQQA